MRLSILVLFCALAASGCGTSEAVPGSPEASDIDRVGADSALDLLRGRYPALDLVETGRGLAIRLRGRAPIIVIDGFRTPFAGEVGDLQADEVVEIEVLTSIADTLIYGEDAARVGVVKITTRLGARE